MQETEAEKVERWRRDEFGSAVDKDGRRLTPLGAEQLATSTADLHDFYDLLAAGCDLETAVDIVS